MRRLVVTTRNVYLERIAAAHSLPSPPARVVSYPTELTERETVVALARRFRHRAPRRIPGGLAFVGDGGDMQTVTVEERSY